MGYAIVMFGVLLVMSLVVVTAYNYGIAKDSEVAPLKAENIYAEKETGKAQTAITINNTCLTDERNDKYLSPQGGSYPSGPHTLKLMVKNNGSKTLNPTKATVLYNTSYINFSVTDWNDHWGLHYDGDEWEYDDDDCFDEDDDEHHNISVWTPLSYACMKTTQSININSGDDKLRLLVVAENGVQTIAPTSPTNFTGVRDSSNKSYLFSWNASYDEDGITYYRIYGIEKPEDIGDCDEYISYAEVQGNQTSTAFNYSQQCGDPCNANWYYLTAVDNLQNEGIQSRTLKCTPNPGTVCD